MTAAEPTILATSGGYARPERGDLALGPLVHHAIGLSRPQGRPRVAHLGTASGDQRSFNAQLGEAASRAGLELTHVNLFPMPTLDDVEAHLLAQDVVWVGGGSVANLLAVWRVHGLEQTFRRVWEAGVVLAGVSAGSICWFRGGTTDSFGPELRAVRDGLGLLPFDNGVHHDSEARRRPTIHRLVADGTFGETHCTDDGAGLHYEGTELVGCVTERPGARCYRVTKGDDGAAVEVALPTVELAR